MLNSHSVSFIFVVYFAVVILQPDLGDSSLNGRLKIVKINKWNVKMIKDRYTHYFAMNFLLRELANGTEKIRSLYGF